MSDGLLNKKISGISGLPQKTQQLVTKEPLEILKTAKKQTVGQEGVRSKNDIVDDIVRQSRGTAVTPEEELKLKEEALKRIRQLEEELEKIREQRKARDEKWDREKAEELSPKAPELPQALVEPTLKPKRGMLGFIRKKQGTKEMGKQTSG